MQQEGEKLIALAGNQSISKYITELSMIPCMDLNEQSNKTYVYFHVSRGCLKYLVKKFDFRQLDL